MLLRQYLMGRIELGVKHYVLQKARRQYKIDLVNKIILIFANECTLCIWMIE